MRDNDILIRQIIFDLEIDSEDAFQSYAEVLNNFTRNNILKILSEIENEEAFSDIDIHIDSLSIDLDLIDILSIENLESFIKSQIVEEIRIRSSNQKHQQYPQTAGFTIEQLLKFFSDYGFLPWSFNTKEKVNTLFNATIGNSSQPLFLHKLLLKDIRSFNRIVEILTPKNSIALFKLILKKDYKLFNQIIELNQNIIATDALSTSTPSSNQVQFYILGLFNKYSNQHKIIVSESVSYLQSVHALQRNEIIKYKEYQSINLPIEVDFKNIQVSSLIKIFINIEKIKLLEILFSEVNQNNKLVNVFPVTSKKTDFGIALYQIIQSYQKKHQYTVQEVVLKLISYLKQKNKLLKFESLTLALLGMELIKNPNFKGIINESLFLDVIHTLGRAVSWSYTEVIDNVQSLLSVQKQAQFNDLIKFTAFEYIQQQKTNSNPIDFFKAIVKALVNNDSRALPINSSLLESEGIARLYAYVNQSKKDENLTLFKSKAALSIDDLLDLQLQSIKEDQRVYYHNQVSSLISSLFKQQIQALSSSEKRSLIKEASQLIVQFSKNKQELISVREIDFVKKKTLQLVDLFIDHQGYSLTNPDKLAQKKTVLQFLDKLLNDGLTSKSKDGAALIKNESIKIFENLFSRLAQPKLSTKEKIGRVDSTAEPAVSVSANTFKEAVDQNMGDLLEFHLQSLKVGERESYNKEVNAFISSLFEQQIDTLSSAEKAAIIENASQIILQYSENITPAVTTTEKRFVLKKAMKLVTLFIEHQARAQAILEKNAIKKNIRQFLSQLLDEEISSKSKSGSELIKKQTVKILENVFSELAKKKIITEKKALQDQLIRKKAYNLDTKYFDYILNLNNEIGMDTGAEKSKKQTTYISLEDILKSSKNLFDFLRTYEVEDELIDYFSNITLKSDINDKFIQLVEKKFKLWIELENKLITIQKSIHFSDLDLTKFKKVLRYFLLKTLGGVDAPKDLILGEFTYDFLQFLELESNVQLSKIKSFVELNLSEDIIEGFNSRVDVNQFSLLPENKRTWLYFRDLYYFYLKTDTIPEWGNIQMIDSEEIINFISLSIKKNEQAFLTKIFSDDAIVKNIFKLLDDASNPLLFELLGVLKPESQKHALTTSIKDFIASTATQLNRSTFYVLERVFLLKLWKSNSMVFIREQLHEIVDSDKIVVGFKVSSKKRTPAELEKLLQYYVDRKSLPKNLEAQQSEIQQLLVSYLLSNPSKAILYIKQLIDDLVFGNPVTNVFTITVLQASLLFDFAQYPSESGYLKAFFTALKKQEKGEVSFEVVRTLLSSFLILKNDKKYLPVILLELIKTQLTTTSKLYKNIINLINQGENDFAIDRLEFDFLALMQKNNLNSLKHFIEFGSTRMEDFHYGIGDFKKIVINQSLLSVKMYAYNWSKNEQKLSRLLSLYTTASERRSLLDLIHSRIRGYLKELFYIFSASNFSKTDLYTQKFPSQDQVKLILTLWGKSNFKVDKPYEFLRDVIRSFLTANKIPEEVLIAHFSEVNWSEIKLLSKRKLTQMFIKPPPKPTKPNIEIANINKLNEELKSGISIQNAGLVIAWPFFNTLFSKMGLTEGQKFKDDLSVQKAIIATQYLVDDSQEYDESELILNKILCGVDIDFYVDTSIKLVDVEIAVCNMALKTIIQQWDKIKSVDALREYFLKREGVLKINESGYELHIEKQTTDILLRFLPWNLSIIKSSIMKLKLIIDWKYI